MTPSQFCVWLAGYSAAKPEVLDEKVRDELNGVIAGLMADKLRGYRGYEAELHRKYEYDPKADDARKILGAMKYRSASDTVGLSDVGIAFSSGT